jgi:glycosyltransferase involved in cell wall biosynthesis
VNILVVSTYPPMPCGIAKYAEQQVQALRAQGHRVNVLSPEGGDGDFQDELCGGFRPLRLLRTVWAYDETYIHFTPQFFYDSTPGRRASRICTSLAFLLVMLLLGRRISFIAHETVKIGDGGRGPLRHHIDRLYWRLAHRVIFHSTVERRYFAEFYRLREDRAAFEIWPQEKFLAPRCTLSRDEARDRLDIPTDVTLLICIGFIQPHKGYERPIEALAKVEGDHLRLKIVGSVRIAWDKAHAYAQQLHQMADKDPRVEVHEAYLSDDLFDTWFVAADYVIVPYHMIWTSAVAARAKVYGRPLIAANTGGLAVQLSSDSYIFNNDEELAGILRQIAERTTPTPAPAPVL